MIIVFGRSSLLSVGWEIKPRDTPRAVHAVHTVRWQNATQLGAVLCIHAYVCTHTVSCIADLKPFCDSGKLALKPQVVVNFINYQ